MTLIRRKRVLAAKIETTVGTAESLSGSDATFNAVNPIIQPTIDMEEREGLGGFGRIASVPGMRMGTATFRIDISYDGTSVPAWATTFLPACGWVNSSGTFTPKTAPPGTAAGVKTLTIATYVDGLLKRISGASGTFVANFPTGRSAYLDFTFTGKYEDESDVAILTPTYSTVLPSRAAGGAFTFNSVDMCAENVTIDAGNNVVPIECVASATGLDYHFIGDRNTTWTANPIKKLVATLDRYGLWTDMNEYELAISVPGAGGGTVEFNSPKAQIVNMQEGDRNGIVSDELTWQANRNGSTVDQEMSIIFTPES